MARKYNQAALLSAQVARMHGLRHMHASLLLASGTDIALVSKRLGHSSISITSDTYSHLLEGVGQQAAEAAAEPTRAGGGSAMVVDPDWWRYSSRP